METSTRKTTPKPKTVKSTLENIGGAAGEVWRHLDANGPTAVGTLKRETKLTNEVLYAALGWLAREGKISTEVDGKEIRVALK